MSDKQAIWFGGWDGLLEVVVIAPVLYVLVVAFVRVSGKRTTGQMNNFDWILTVAMGSIVASGIVIDTVEVAEAAAAVAMLIGLQFALTKIAKRHSVIDRLVKIEPRLLISRGRVNDDALSAERITHDELATALRMNGVTRIDQVEWMLLENTGKFSVLTKEQSRVGIDPLVMTGEMARDKRRAARGE